MNAYETAYVQTSQSTADTMKTLEGLIDATSLRNVLTLLSEVCGEKAEHIRSNWQDEALAQCWEKAANGVNKAHTAAYVNGKL